MPGLNLTRLEQDFGSTQLNPKPFEVFPGTGARGSDAFFLPIKTFMSHWMCTELLLMSEGCF